MTSFMPLPFARTAIFALSLISCYAFSQSNNEQNWYEDINWHGFAAQGFSYTDRNNFLGSSSNGSFKFNEAAINASWQGELPIQYSAQVLYKQTGNADHNGLDLDYAIVDWRAFDTFDSSAGLRLGRLKNSYGFYNETRDVAATRPSILLPEGIYVDYLRELLHSSDSIGLYGDTSLPHGSLSFSSVIGRPILNDDSSNAILSADTGGELNNERAFVVRLGYENGTGSFRAAFSYIQLKVDFEAVPGSGFNSDEVKTELYMTSLAFSWEQWELVGEFQRRNLIYNDVYGFYPFNMDKPGEGGYLQLGYSFTPKFSVFMRKEEVYLDRDDKDGSGFQAATEALPDPIPKVRASDSFAKDTTLGMRYQPNFNWSFAAEYHAVNGTLWLPNVENPDLDNQRTKWNMFLLQAAYRF